MEKVIVEVKVGRRKYIEEIDLAAQREYFDELKSNGANPRMADVTFEHWVREVSFDAKDIGKFNGDANHFIYGYWESLCQSDHAPRNLYPMYEDATDPTIITVWWE